MLGLLTSEWLKIRSVRSTYCALTVAVAGVPLMAWLAWYATGLWDGGGPGYHHATTVPGAPLAAAIGELALGVLGVLAATSEYATGTIRPSLVAAPRRPLLLVAKVAVVAGTSFVAGEAIVFATYFISARIIGDRPMIAWQGHPAAPFYTAAAVSGEIPVLLTLGLSVMLFALVGLGLGMAMRSAAGPIATLVALVYLLPIVSLHLPQPWSEWLMAVTLPNVAPQLAGQPAYAEIGGQGAALPPLVALAVMVGYVALSIGGAAILLTRRDV